MSFQKSILTNTAPSIFNHPPGVGVFVSIFFFSALEAKFGHGFCRFQEKPMNYTEKEE